MFVNNFQLEISEKKNIFVFIFIYISFVLAKITLLCYVINRIVKYGIV